MRSLIFITAFHDTKYFKSAFESGANDFIKKPFDLEELGQRISNIKRQFGLDSKIVIEEGILSAYWYYSAQKESLESEIYYKLEHLADTISGKIINAQMKGLVLELPQKDGFEYSLIPTSQKEKYSAGYFQSDVAKVLVSDAP